MEWTYENIYIILMNFFFGSVTCGMFVATIFPYGFMISDEVAIQVSRPLLLSTFYHICNMSLTYRNNIQILALHIIIHFFLSAHFGFIITRCILIICCFILLRTNLPPVIIDLICTCIICIQNSLNFVFSFTLTLKYP